MEEMLGSFQSSLSSLSWEIRALQGQAGAMNLRLRNRRQVRERLGGLLDELVVPPDMISVILEAPVTSPEFVAQLRALDAILMKFPLDFRGFQWDFDEILTDFSHFLIFSPHFLPSHVILEAPVTSPEFVSQLVILEAPVTSLEFVAQLRALDAIS
ncbi:vacuolar protein sorting-associated protein 52 homolog, partial [Passer montanus]|uniref:vacuolar protein sorting-associated protein 52 homolog n=1 Tax=Passer montanus TaxID=9160 RepID=UPI0019607427